MTSETRYMRCDSWTVNGLTADQLKTAVSGNAESAGGSNPKAGDLTVYWAWDVIKRTTAGVMLFRKIFTAKTVNWDDGDTLEVTAKCQLKQGA